MTRLQKIGQKAKAATRVLASTDAKKGVVLVSIADGLVANVERIISVNKIDLEQTCAGGISGSMLDRLTLNGARAKDMAKGTWQVAAQTGPISRILSGEVRLNGMEIEKVVVLLNVTGMIYETRLNVTVDAAMLYLKVSSAIILHSGKEAVHSNTATTEVMCNAIGSIDLSHDSIQPIEDTSRQSPVELMGPTEYLDTLTPHGGMGLIRSTKESSHIPVTEAGVGNCHVYINDSTDLEMAARIIFNSKTPRPSVCNMAETLLVHSAVAEKFLPVAKKMLDEKKVQLRVDECVLQNLGACDMVIPTVEGNQATESSDYILTVHAVDPLDETIRYTSKYSFGHNEVIVANNYGRARQFTSRVDAATVYVNISMRFTDDSQFGPGAEVGVFIRKLYTRGPMGVNELTSQKFIVTGDGQVRE